MTAGWLRGVRRIYVLPIAFYRRFLSPLKPPTCRFHPTCSAYALEAVTTRGILRGTLLSVWRILRCQPFSKGGYDPVPGSSRDEAGPAAPPNSPPNSPGNSPPSAPESTDLES